MTFEQLVVFVAVAERQHLTKAAEALRLTPSAVSASIKTLENFYNVRLFNRVGRGIELTREGRAFLFEAKETIARARTAEALLSELGGLKTGQIDLQASQTIANYWLPERLLAFATLYPGIGINLRIGNTTTVASAIRAGDAEIGFVEGAFTEQGFAAAAVNSDRMVIVASSRLAGTVDAERLKRLDWIMRESGSGTRSVLEQDLAALGVDPQGLRIRLTLPSNESVLNAVMSGDCVTAMSETVVAPFVAGGRLRVADIELAPRQFTLLRHKERHLSAAAKEFEAFCHTYVVQGT